ncbi:hypothetical protein HPB49_004959 [Dermacentor silvarum]|uniref:Uncharacterized protein n=1 Tax=Dermacentor silvarum TaxID=543639 RepID=A0ACB8CJD2_DERSI|nr:hypothetical protein HPB49_004959 [Dermacentor silvarum]
MAVCDSAYKFLYVEVGGSGGESDGGVFGRSTLCKALETGKLGIPQPTAIPGGHVAPYVILGDEAFPLKEYLMRPYPKRYIKTDTTLPVVSISASVTSWSASCATDNDVFAAFVSASSVVVSGIVSDAAAEGSAPPFAS